MTHPLSNEDLSSPFIHTSEGFKIDLRDTMYRYGVAFYRQATPDGRGGGFVAESAYVPRHIAIPWDWVVFEDTRVLDDAHLYLAGTGPRIIGNVSRVSEVLRDYDRPLLCDAAGRRRRLHLVWRAKDVKIPPYDNASSVSFQLNT